MEKEKKYYIVFDWMRVFACAAVLFYHLNLLKGGYLAVCIFFAFSGYLSCISAFQKENFSLLSYYKKRLKKLYLPLLVVVFLTIGVFSFFPNLSWMYLKPETTSVLLGYNNWWQISVNLDYFACHVQSPFIPLWYISILLQFDFFFPFLFLFFRKLGDKIHRLIPCIVTFFISIVGSIFFCIMNRVSGMMVSYYNSFTRIFSLFLGLSLGFIHSYYGNLIPHFFKKKLLSKAVVGIYFLLFFLFFLLVDAQSSWYSFTMILVTFLTIRLIDYGTLSVSNHFRFIDKMIQSLASVSYEVYLIQYPVIFFTESWDMALYFKIPLLIFIILLLSYGLHFAISFCQKKKGIAKIFIFLFLSIGVFYGVSQFFLAKDYSQEMKLLEEQLEQNKSVMLEKQENYKLELQQENEAWLKKLDALEISIQELNRIVSQLPVVGVGDSVMLGALDQLYQKFPNGYFDAQISRTAWVLKGILQSLKTSNRFGNPVVINLGANGDCSDTCKVELMELCEDREVFWINVTNDSEVHVNDGLNSLASSYQHLHIIDWNSVSHQHPEYFVADGIHLTEIGKKAYTETIYDAIYQIYLKQYQQKRDEMVQSREEKLNKVSFYGNDILLSIYHDVQSDFPDSQFVADKHFSSSEFLNYLEQEEKNNMLGYHIVLVLDQQVSFSEEEYRRLMDFSKNHALYIFSFNEQAVKMLSSLKGENFNIFDFYPELLNHPDYFMADHTHLTEAGQKAFYQFFRDSLYTLKK